MNRSIVWALATVLAASCGSSNPSAPPTLGNIGDTHETNHAPSPDGAGGGADPTTQFRASFANPGGMWLPAQMSLPQHRDNFRNLGVKLDSKTLSEPLQEPLAAVVNIGGCTGSFVSPEGLIVTNHHCVQDALQHNSTPDDNLVENGYLAKTRADEKSSGPAARVLVVQKYSDVTKEMRDGLDKIKDPVARKDELDKREKQLIATCEKHKGMRCQVSGFFRDSMFQLIEMLEIKDIRVVYVPARSVGNYGGEVDNWHWPRHTGDWSFVRAYVGKDGNPAEYSADNVPYRSAHYLKVSTAGVKQNDFVMVTGYPGRTERTATAVAAHFDVETGIPYVVGYLKDMYALVEEHLKDGGETAIKAGVRKQRFQNALAKQDGILKGMSAKPELIKQKDELDAKIAEYANAQGHEATKASLTKLAEIESEQHKTFRADFDRGQALNASMLLGAAITFVHWADERTKKDADRRPGFQDRDMARAMAGQKSFSKRYDKTLDKAQLRLALVRSLANKDDDHTWMATLLDAKKGQKLDEALIDKTLNAWFDKPQLEDTKVRVALLDKGSMDSMRNSKDPFVRAAIRLWSTIKAQEKKEDARRGDLELVAPAYAEAMKDVLGGMLSPDANSTLRITYGTVKPAKAGEGPDSAFTTASQIPAKNTGKMPFDAPKKLLDAIAAKNYGPYADKKLGDLPIDFTSDLDITGGNSGSPTLNSKGELVGLAFDGNLEGVASDVVFDPTLTRVIHVDARYMVWTMDALDGAKHLLKEMGIEPRIQ